MYLVIEGRRGGRLTEMRRWLPWLVVGSGMVVVFRMLAQSGMGRPALAERMSAKCERMLAGMPASFPPNRMMADLETVKARTARILELLEEDPSQMHRPKEVLKKSM